MVDVSSVASERQASRELPGDEVIEEVADVLAIRNPGEGRVLAAKAITAVETDERQKLCLAPAKSHRRERVNTFVEGHIESYIGASRSISTPGNSVP